MSSRTGSHQLSNGLFVSGRPEQQLKEKQSSMSVRAVPYTGGDVKKSGEFGKMYGVGDHAQVGLPKVPFRAPGSSQQNSGSARSGSNSGQLGPKPSNSGQMNKKSSSSSFSGPITPIQPTGLITSGNLCSAGSNRRSGQVDTISAPNTFSKNVYGSAVTSLGEEVKLEYKLSRLAVWVSLVVVVMGLLVGSFLVVAVKKAVVLFAMVALLVPAAGILIWNYAYKKRGVLQFLRNYPSRELRGANDGDYVKISGVVTCGGIPLETSFERIPRCVYTSSELYEYRGCSRKQTNAKQRMFSWGCRHSEKYVADFYISDSKSGLRALVKAGSGAKVSPFVESSKIIDVTKDNKDFSPNFLSWLSDRGLSNDDKVMRLKESCVREGTTVSVMGVIRTHEHVLMITPPSEPISTGCCWPCCLLPTYIEGLILTCDAGQNEEAIPV